MKKTLFLSVFILLVFILSSYYKPAEQNLYAAYYTQKVNAFKKKQAELLDSIKNNSLTAEQVQSIIVMIKKNRLALKEIDFWLRYFEPIAYKKINGPLPVEWETEVFEKYEAPYKREGAGLTLAALYLAEDDLNKDSLAVLIYTSLQATDVFLADSITRQLKTHDHFYLANRLFLLNLAAIYTTGFECPDKEQIIPELTQMLEGTRNLYRAFNQSFPQTKINNNYINLFDSLCAFVLKEPMDFIRFNHFNFIQNFINPLYQLNQGMIRDYQVRTINYNDYTLNKHATSIFDKSLFRGQNNKGVYIGIDDTSQLEELKAAGKLLFYDPVLSVNNKRSCASCHIPAQYFTDTTVATSLQLNQKSLLPRNTPSLVNVIHNHLLMLDGKHFNLENQAKDVMTNPVELGNNEEELLKKILSFKEYKVVFKKYLKTTPQYNKVNMEHIASALILYYADFSYYESPFDNAINKKKWISTEVINGFNLFMGKAQCATCHFVPQFNGGKPPYISSEFEVIGVPADSTFKMLSPDKGRYTINPAKETNTAFRTTTIRNAAFTKPYMHNGVFNTLDEVINFYDAGGGKGKGLSVPNQTLSADSLKLSTDEKRSIIAFINALNEDIPLPAAPLKLPVSKNKLLNNRVVGGQY